MGKAGPRLSKHYLQTELLMSHIVNVGSFCPVSLYWKLHFLPKLLLDRVNLG